MTNLDDRELQLRKKLAETRSYAIAQIIIYAEKDEKLSSEVEKLQSLLSELLIKLDDEALASIAALARIAHKTSTSLKTAQGMISASAKTNS